MSIQILCPLFLSLFFFSYWSLLDSSPTPAALIEDLIWQKSSYNYILEIVFTFLHLPNKTLLQLDLLES